MLSTTAIVRAIAIAIVIAIIMMIVRAFIVTVAAIAVHQNAHAEVRFNQHLAHAEVCFNQHLALASCGSICRKRRTGRGSRCSVAFGGRGKASASSLIFACFVNEIGLWAFQWRWRQRLTRWRRHSRVHLRHRCGRRIVIITADDQSAGKLPASSTRTIKLPAGPGNRGGGEQHCI